MNDNQRYIEQAVADEVRLGRVRDREEGRKLGPLDEYLLDAYRARTAAYWATTYVLDRYWGTFPSEDRF